jgi:hypothetical protein
MTKIRTRIAIVTLAAGLALGGMTTQASAYGEWLWAPTWNIIVPEDTTAAFINETSLRGFSLEGRWFKTDYISYGLSLGWNVLDKKEFRTDNVAGGTITGTQFRYINTYPLLVNAHYYLGQWSLTRPFFGLNAGGYVVERRVEVGLLATEERKWQWGIAPEVGILFPFSVDVSGFFNARYNYAWESGDNPAMVYWSFGVGLAWY